MTEYTVTLTEAQLAALAVRIADAGDPDRWRTKDGVAAYFACSPRKVEEWQAAGMPHTTIAGKVKFRVAVAEKWLEANGHIQAGGGEDPRRHIDPGCTVVRTQSAPASDGTDPGHDREVSPDG